MTDNELEQRLRNHYRSLDPSTAPRGLALRIEDGMTRPASRWAFLGRMPAIATGIAAVAVVALVIAFRPGGLLTPVGASPSVETPTPPSASATPHPSPAISPLPTQTAPGGTIPPSTVPWTSLDVQPLTGGPTAGSITAWSGGYLALGGENPGAAWISPDGRTWTALPDGTFGNPGATMAAASPDGVVVVAEAGDGSTSAWRSTDGRTWTSSPAPSLSVLDGGLAGTGGGLVAVAGGATPGLVYSADGTTWQPVTLTGSAGVSVRGVTAFGSGFVAVGGPKTEAGSPVAWWSNDGLQWSLADVASNPGAAFTHEVFAAEHGLVATSQTHTVPGLSSYWTSVDGQSWRQSTANPLGTIQDGEGAGSVNGSFVSDGALLLAYGAEAFGQPTEYWISLDGIYWSRLTLTGDTPATETGQVTPFLMRDGILFTGSDGTWFGSATP